MANSSTKSMKDQPSVVEPTQTFRLAVEGRLPGLRLPVKWPGAGEKKSWERANADLIATLEQLRGTTEKKLERMGDYL